MLEAAKMDQSEDLIHFDKDQTVMVEDWVRPAPGLQVWLGVPGLQWLVPTKGGLRKDNR